MVKASVKDPLGWWQFLPVSLALGKWLPPCFLISAQGEECHSPQQGYGETPARLLQNQSLFQLVPLILGQGLGPQFPYEPNGPWPPPLMTLRLLVQ